MKGSDAMAVKEGESRRKLELRIDSHVAKEGRKFH